MSSDINEKNKITMCSDDPLKCANDPYIVDCILKAITNRLIESIANNNIDHFHINDLKYEDNYIDITIGYPIDELVVFDIDGNIIITPNNAKKIASVLDKIVNFFKKIGKNSIPSKIKEIKKNIEDVQKSELIDEKRSVLDLLKGISAPISAGFSSILNYLSDVDWTVLRPDYIQESTLTAEDYENLPIRVIENVANTLEQQNKLSTTSTIIGDTVNEIESSVTPNTNISRSIISNIGAGTGLFKTQAELNSAQRELLSAPVSTPVSTPVSVSASTSAPAPASTSASTSAPDINELEKEMNENKLLIKEANNLRKKLREILNKNPSDNLKKVITTNIGKITPIIDTLGYDNYYLEDNQKTILQEVLNKKLYQ